MVNTFGVANGTVLYYSIAGNNITAGDSLDPLTGAITINNNTCVFLGTIVADSLTEGAETFVATLHTGSASGPSVAYTGSIVINDTSTGAPAGNSGIKRCLVNPYDQIVTGETGFDLSILQCADGLIYTTNVYRQSQQTGKLILIGDRPQSHGFDSWQNFVNESRKYANFTHAYVYDELFWTGTGINIGWQEAGVNQSAAVARAAGLKTVVTIIPDIVLSAGFAMTSVNSFDIISLDLYPSLMLTPAYGGAYSTNGYKQKLYSAMQKLRGMGFVGEFWYIYQAFALHSDPDTITQTYLNQQRDVVNSALAMGIAGIVPWGLYMSAEQIAAEPNLYPLHGTQWESYVRL